MPFRYRVDQLEQLLSRLCRNVQGIDQAVIVSSEGFVVAAYPGGPEAQAGVLGRSPTVAATAANAIALGERALDRLDQGRFLRLIIEGESGAMIVYPIDGSDAALVALVDPDAKMGLASMAMRQSIQQIASILARAGPALD